jgi:hypothetical protein
VTSAPAVHGTNVVGGGATVGTAVVVGTTTDAVAVTVRGVAVVGALVGTAVVVGAPVVVGTAVVVGIGRLRDTLRVAPLCVGVDVGPATTTTGVADMWRVMVAVRAAAAAVAVRVGGATCRVGVGVRPTECVAVGTVADTVCVSVALRGDSDRESVVVVTVRDDCAAVEPKHATSRMTVIVIRSMQPQAVFPTTARRTTQQLATAAVLNTRRIAHGSGIRTKKR